MRWLFTWQSKLKFKDAGSLSIPSKVNILSSSVHHFSPFTHSSTVVNQNKRSPTSFTPSLLFFISPSLLNYLSTYPTISLYILERRYGLLCIDPSLSLSKCSPFSSPFQPLHALCDPSELKKKMITMVSQLALSLSFSLSIYMYSYKEPYNVCLASKPQNTAAS